MAVNKITNKQVVNKETINRAHQVSTKNTTIRGNRETTIVPGNNFSDNYSVTLKDIDTSLMSYVKKTSNSASYLIIPLAVIIGFLRAYQ